MFVVYTTIIRITPTSKSSTFRNKAVITILLKLPKVHKKNINAESTKPAACVCVSDS